MIKHTQNYLKIEENGESDNPYLEYVKLSIPRLLTLQDRNEFSLTYGCFDRSFWHFKTVTDFPNATCQQAVLALALLYKNDFTGNLYFGNKKILDYVIAGIKYWIKLQHKDGSVDEFFPNEHSFVATAFTTYGMAETYTVVQSDVDSSDTKDIIAAILKAGDWILRNNNLYVANQMLGASLSLLKVFRLSGDKRYLLGSEQKMDIALKLQNKEGWFYEYGGPDIGYLSLSIDFLAKYYQESRQERVLKTGMDAIRFLQYFIHPDGSAGGEYGSRNTQFILPHGLEIFSEYCDEANFILQFLYKGLKSKNSLAPLFIEDRYFSFFYLPNYVQSLYHYKPKREVKLSQKMVCIFPEAKLIRFQRAPYKIIIGVSKNGVVKIFEGEKLIFSDVGFFCEISNKKIATSQFLNLSTKLATSSISTNNGEITISIKGNFVEVYNKLPMTKYLMPFRAINYIFLRSKNLRKFFNQFLKKKLVMGKKPVPISFKKKILLRPNEIIIEDKITSSVKLKRLIIERSGTAMYNATSTCYLHHEIEKLKTDLDDLNFASYINNYGSIHLERVFNFASRTFNWQVVRKLQNSIL
jgi:hypothetical protein